MREFDALRGFSMFLVVLIHVMAGLGLPAETTVLGSFFIPFYLPLFFFVSGFFIFRISEKWSLTTIKRVTGQKFKAQIICTLLFYALLYYTRGKNPFGWLDHGFQAYWFTQVLFAMYIAYLGAILLSKLFKRDLALQIMILVAVVSIGIMTFHLLPHSRVITILNGANICYFIQFYVAGMCFRKYQNAFLKLISNDYFKAVAIVGFVGLFATSYSDAFDNLEFMKNLLFTIIMPYFGLTMVITLFHSARNYFNGDHFGAKLLCLVGRRTLDIYMLHYFFLPSLICLQEFLAPNNMILFQLLIGGGIAIAIIAISLLFSSCIRSSAFLANWLFGVRKLSIQHK